MTLLRFITTGISFFSVCLFFSLNLGFSDPHRDARRQLLLCGPQLENPAQNSQDSSVVTSAQDPSLPPAHPISPDVQAILKRIREMPVTNLRFLDPRTLDGLSTHHRAFVTLWAEFVTSHLRNKADNLVNLRPTQAKEQNRGRYLNLRELDLTRSETNQPPSPYESWTEAWTALHLWLNRVHREFTSRAQDMPHDIYADWHHVLSVLDQPDSLLRRGLNLEGLGSGAFWAPLIHELPIREELKDRLGIPAGEPPALFFSRVIDSLLGVIEMEASTRAGFGHNKIELLQQFKADLLAWHRFLKGPQNGGETEADFRHLLSVEGVPLGDALVGRLVIHEREGRLPLFYDAIEPASSLNLNSHVSTKLLNASTSVFTNNTSTTSAVDQQPTRPTFFEIILTPGAGTTKSIVGGLRAPANTLAGLMDGVGQVSARGLPGGPAGTLHPTAQDVLEHISESLGGGSKSDTLTTGTGEDNSSIKVALPRSMGSFHALMGQLFGKEPVGDVLALMSLCDQRTLSGSGLAALVNEWIGGLFPGLDAAQLNTANRIARDFHRAMEMAREQGHLAEAGWGAILFQGLNDEDAGVGLQPDDVRRIYEGYRDRYIPWSPVVLLPDSLQPYLDQFSIDELNVLIPLSMGRHFLLSGNPNLADESALRNPELRRAIEILKQHNIPPEHWPRQRDQTLELLFHIFGYMDYVRLGPDGRGAPWPFAEAATLQRKFQKTLLALYRDRFFNNRTNSTRDAASLAAKLAHQRPGSTPATPKPPRLGFSDIATSEFIDGLNQGQNDGIWANISWLHIMGSQIIGLPLIRSKTGGGALSFQEQRSQENGAQETFNRKHELFRGLYDKIETFYNQERRRVQALLAHQRI